MYLKISWRFERFTAHLARELALAVHVLPVAAHAARTPESFAAIDTHVREFACVFAYVDFQAIFVDESALIRKCFTISIYEPDTKLTQHCNVDTDAV